MQNVCPNPGCGAAYTLSPQHLGRQFVCRKCGSTLLAEPQGLRLVGAAPAAAYSTTETTPTEAAAPNANFTAPSAQTLARKSASRAPFGQSLHTKLLADPVTLAFAAGSVLVIFFLFMPILDTEKVERRRAAINFGDLTQQRFEKEARQKDHRSTAELDDAKKRRDAWETEKSGLEQDEEQAKIDSDNNHYWYTWGTLIGFLVLAVAALGYLSPEQPTVRKVTGCIIICAILLLVFFRILTK